MRVIPPATRGPAAFVLLVLGAGAAAAGPTTKPRAEGPGAEYLAVLEALTARPPDPGRPARPGLLDALLEGPRDRIVDTSVDDDRFHPLYSRGIVLGSLMSPPGLVETSPFLGKSAFLAAMAAALTGAETLPGSGGPGPSFRGGWSGAHWNAAAGGGGPGGPGGEGGPLSLDNRPAPFDLSRARDSAVLFLAFVCTAVPTILGLLGVGDRDRWVVLSLKFFAIFLAAVFLSVFSYRNYDPTWHPMAEGLVLVTLGAGTGCLAAGAFGRAQPEE